MKSRTLTASLSLSILFLASCSGPKGKEKQLERIGELEERVDSISSEGKLPKKKMRKLMAEYKSYANQFPKDSLAPHQLLRAGGVARSLKEPQRAINIYRQILNEYPDFSKEPTVRFLLAFVYDRDLKKKKKARSLYQTVIDSFPEHKLARDAEQYLKVMGLSDKELIERFEKKRKKRDSTRSDSAEKAS
ncbi:MAG: tol-pal system YbgF family protein [Flavobacteriales bacterium]